MIIPPSTPKEVEDRIEKLLDTPESSSRKEAVAVLRDACIEMKDENPNVFDDLPADTQKRIDTLIKTGVLGVRSARSGDAAGAKLPKTGGLMGAVIFILIGMAMIVTGIVMKRRRQT